MSYPTNVSSVPATSVKVIDYLGTPKLINFAGMSEDGRFARYSDLSTPEWFTQLRVSRVYDVSEFSAVCLCGNTSCHFVQSADKTLGGHNAELLKMVLPA